jgi:Rod binding domain-containing protein
MPGGAGDASGQKLRQASEDFEAMLIGQMLQSIRESALSGWQETGDQSGAIALEMAEGQMARMMASNGGLGLARTLRDSLQKEPVESGS